jgi:hypothetical protein
MNARIVRNGKLEEIKIAYFELINNKNKYITMYPDKVLATTKDIISIDLKDIQEIAIREGEKGIE